jgi:predicted ATPase
MNTQRELIETNKQIYFDYSSILQRNHIKEEITHILQLFDSKYCDVQYKKGIYIYGSPGSGKTHFVVHLLKEIGYDVIKYDAGEP